MAADHSFDIVSEINLQEMDNAVNQAVKEIQKEILRGEEEILRGEVHI